MTSFLAKFCGKKFFIILMETEKIRNVFAIQPSMMSCKTKKSKGTNSDIPAAALNEVIGFKALNC